MAEIVSPQDKDLRISWRSLWISSYQLLFDEIKKKLVHAILPQISQSSEAFRIEGIELSYYRRRRWSRLPELNRRPSNYESDALPTELSRLRMHSLEPNAKRVCTIRMRAFECQAASR